MNFHYMSQKLFLYQKGSNIIFKIPRCDLKPPAKKLEFKIESPGRSGRLRDGTRSLLLRPYSLLKQQINLLKLN